jgi:quinol monooxygenase YgiN
MANFAIIGTIKTVPGKRDEYLTFLVAHRKRCLATEPGTLQFEVVVPHAEADTLMLYEVYTNKEAFDAHFSGSSIKQFFQETAALQVSMTGVRGELAA